jgi:acyl-CoA thioester hydrolase
VTVPPSISRVRVRYAETDQMGVVYYANYFVWFEVGRTDLLRAAGWSYREMETEGFQLPVIEAHCVYRQPAKYDDELDIRTSGASVSPVRVQFTYEIVRTSDQATIATGTTVHATLDRNGRPCRLPDRVRHILTASASEADAAPRRPVGDTREHNHASASAAGADAAPRRPVRDTREHNHASASAAGADAAPRRPVGDTREHNHASASARGGGAPRESNECAH